MFALATLAVPYAVLLPSTTFAVDKAYTDHGIIICAPAFALMLVAGVIVIKKLINFHFLFYWPAICGEPKFVQFSFNVGVKEMFSVSPV